MRDAGTALFFGTGDSAVVADNPAFDAIEANDAITVEAWIRIDGWPDGWLSVVDKFSPATGFGWSFQIHESGGLDFLANSGASVSGHFVPQLHQWTHVAFSYSRADGVARFFVNGKLESSQPFDGEIEDTLDGDFLLGHNPSGANEYSQGAIDELRLWSRARSAEEIARDLRNGLTGREDGLVGYWKFDDGEGQFVRDSTGHGLTGTLRGEPGRIESGACLRAPDTVQGPVDQRTWRFNSPIQGPLNPQDFTMVGPDGQSVRILRVEGQADTFVLHFEPVNRPGIYTITGPVNIRDLSGNLIDQDKDGIGGERGDDEPVDQFLVRSGMPKVSVTNVLQDEGDDSTSQFEFTVSLSEAMAEPVVVEYQTRDDTAHRGDDYLAEHGFLTFAPGTTRQVITIVVRGDRAVEPNESFQLLVGEPLAGNDIVSLARMDIDGDGAITFRDANHILSALIHQRSVDSAMDQDGDGIVSPSDLLLVVNHVMRFERGATRGTGTIRNDDVQVAQLPAEDDRTSATPLAQALGAAQATVMPPPPKSDVTLPIAAPQSFSTTTGNEVPSVDAIAAIRSDAPVAARVAEARVVDIALIAYLSDVGQTHLAGVEPGDEPPTREAATAGRTGRNPPSTVRAIGVRRGAEEPVPESWWNTGLVAVLVGLPAVAAAWRIVSRWRPRWKRLPIEALSTS